MMNFEVTASNEGLKDGGVAVKKKRQHRFDRYDTIEIDPKIVKEVNRDSDLRIDQQCSMSDLPSPTLRTIKGSDDEYFQNEHEHLISPVRNL